MCEGYTGQDAYNDMFIVGNVNGVDFYNQTLTGDVTQSITGSRIDCHHEPCVVEGVDTYNMCTTGEKSKTITCAATDHNHVPCAVKTGTRYIVRRLTPTECERLQAYPDGWTDIGDWVDSKGRTRKTTDSNRYKALGNSICTDAWATPLERISKILAEDGHTPTMASLFDGIGGFPLVWERINGKGTCLWASEIEEFPMAVTEKRINELHGMLDRGEYDE